MLAGRVDIALIGRSQLAVVDTGNSPWVGGGVGKEDVDGNEIAVGGPLPTKLPADEHGNGAAVVRISRGHLIVGRRQIESCYKS